MCFRSYVNSDGHQVYNISFVQKSNGIFLKIHDNIDYEFYFGFNTTFGQIRDIFMKKLNNFNQIIFKFNSQNVKWDEFVYNYVPKDFIDWKSQNNVIDFY